MELKIDLLETKSKKSIFRVVFGILMFLSAISWFIFRIVEDRSITPFDWVFFGVLSFNGIFHFTEGLGYLLGKAYILINLEWISLKASVFDKKQYVNWDEIKSIDYKFNKFEIEKTDNTNMILDLSKFDYRSINEIKKAINDITKEKNIQASL